MTDIITLVLDLKVWLKSPAELDAVSYGFVTVIKGAAKEATPKLKPQITKELLFPAEVRQLVQQRRKWNVKPHILLPPPVFQTIFKFPSKARQ